MHIGAAVTADIIRPLVRHDAGGREGALDEIHRAFHIAGTVGVFDTQDEVAVLRLGKEIGIEGGAQVADVHEAGRTRRETGANLFISQSYFLLFSHFFRNVYRARYMIMALTAPGSS